MTEPHRPRVKYVIGPDGSPLTIADLPAPGTKRWVIRRKAEVVAAVRGGLLSLEEACAALHADRRRIPVLAVFDRPARPRRACAPRASSSTALKSNPTEFLKRRLATAGVLHQHDPGKACPGRSGMGTVRPRKAQYAAKELLAELPDNQTPAQCPIAATSERFFCAGHQETETDHETCTVEDAPPH